MEEETQYCGTPSATPEEPVNLELEPCGFCGRTFIPTTLAKHINICQKMATKKRKQFDSFRQRREGTDLAVFLPKNYGLPTPKHDEPKQSPPKANQNTSVAAHRQIDNTPKQVTPVEIKKPMTSKVSPPTSGLQSTVSKEKVKPKSVTKLPQNEKCPHCERHFGAKAYERHVEWCKEKTRLSTNQNNSNLSAAKERLQARTKYRAPNLKTKRGLLREKYSGVNCEEVNNEFPDGIFDHAPQTPSANRDELKITMSTSLSSSIMSDGTLPRKKDDRCSKIVTSVSEPIIMNNCKFPHKTTESKNLISSSTILSKQTSSTKKSNESFVLNEIGKFMEETQYSRDKINSCRYDSINRTTEKPSKNDGKRCDPHDAWAAARQLEFEFDTPDSKVSKTKDLVKLNCNSSKHKYAEEKEILGFKMNIENPEEAITCFSTNKSLNGEINEQKINLNESSENCKDSDYLYFIMDHEEHPKLLEDSKLESNSKVQSEESEFRNHKNNKILLPLNFSEDGEDEQSDNTESPLINNNNSQSPSTLNRDYQDKDANREIFITIETSPNECSPSPCDPPSYPQEDETDKNGNPKTEVQEVSKGNEKQDTFEDFGDSNRNSARNINKLYCQNDSGSPFTSDAGKMMYAADSDEISSIEGYPVRQGSRGKLNSDSAYGSLSRHSAEQRPVRRSSSKTRMQSATSILEQPVRYKSLQKIESKPRNRNTSASSSGSEAPVLPILPQEGGRQEKESQFRKDMRMSKFCYECGSKFLISQAKFCMECGVKRIVLD